MPDPAPAPEGPPMAVIWGRLAHQLKTLAETTRTLEGAASNCQSDSVDPETIRQLQAFDFLEQSLEDLASLAADLGAAESTMNLSGPKLNEIAANLRLASTKGLLAHDDNTVAQSYQGQKLGETVLF